MTFIRHFFIFFAFMFLSLSVSAANSMLRIACDGDSVGAGISINGQFKGECPLDIATPAGKLNLRASISVDSERERVFEQEIHLGGDVVKRVEIQLSLPRYKPEVRQKKEDRLSKVVVEFRNRGVEPGNGKRFRDCPDCPELVLLPFFDFGKFNGQTNQEYPLVDHLMAVGAYPITFDEWDLCERDDVCPHAEETPSVDPKSIGRGRKPVVNVSWTDIQFYLNWLSKKSGKTYKLLSEGEWLFSCKAGTISSPYCGGDNLNSVAWYDGNSGQATHPVGSKNPNSWGLYDMSGNVWEWTSDCYSQDCIFRVLRGGSWLNNEQELHLTNRYWASVESRYTDSGFRAMRIVP